MKYKQLTKIVESLIREDKRNAADDMRLIAEVIKELTKDKPEHKAELQQVHNILLKWYDLHLPNIMSVIRSRQEILSEHPELKHPETDRIRKQREKEFREYFRKGHNTDE